MKRVVLFVLLALMLICIGLVIGVSVGYSLGWVGFQIRTQEVGHEEVASSTLLAFQDEIGGTATAQLFETLGGIATQAATTPTPTQTQEMTLPVVATTTEDLEVTPPSTSAPTATALNTPTATSTPLPTVALRPVIWFCEDEAYDSLEAALENRFSDVERYGAETCGELVDREGPEPTVVYIDHIEVVGMEVVGPKTVTLLLQKFPSAKFVVVSGLDVAEEYEDFGESVVFVQNLKQGDWSNVLDAIENAIE
jgi:hypothetical protein